MEEALNKKEVVKRFTEANDKDLFCPDCFSFLEIIKKDLGECLYCDKKVHINEEFKKKMEEWRKEKELV